MSERPCRPRLLIGIGIKKWLSDCDITCGGLKQGGCRRPKLSNRRVAGKAGRQFPRSPFQHKMSVFRGKINRIVLQNLPVFRQFQLQRGGFLQPLYHSGKKTLRQVLNHGYRSGKSCMQPRENCLERLRPTRRTPDGNNFKITNSNVPNPVFNLFYLILEFRICQKTKIVLLFSTE